VRNVLYGIGACIAGVVMTFMGTQDTLALSKLKKSGERVEIPSPEEYVEHTKSGSSTYTAQFSFVTPQGVPVTAKKSFPKALIADYENGTPVYGRYDPRSPGDFVFEKQESEWFVILIGLAFIGGGIWYARKKPEPAPEA
jgi:hypothetical protein